jgi:hypothetical protein
MAIPGDKLIDEAIDRAVRELMGVDPPAGLRARVLSRLEHRPERLRTVPRAVAYAGLAAAVVLLVLVVSRREPDPAPGTQIAATTTESPLPQPAVPTRPVVESSPPAVRPPGPRVAPDHLREPLPEDRLLSAASLAPEPDRGSAPDPGSAACGDSYAPLRSLAGAPCAPSVDPGPLMPLPAIEVRLIETRPIEAGQVAVSPLSAIAPLTIEPLPSAGGRN